MAPRVPDRIGERTHQDTMPPKPLWYAKLMHLGDVPPMVTPTMAETIAWVVDTGMPVKVARSRNSDAERRATSMPGVVWRERELVGCDRAAL